MDSLPHRFAQVLLVLGGLGLGAFGLFWLQFEMVGGLVVTGLGALLFVLGVWGPQNFKRLALRFKDWSVEIEGRDEPPNPGPLPAPEPEPANTLPPAAPSQLEESAEGEVRISTARLPTTSHLLVGREEQLARLTAAWESPSTHVLSVVAPGGVGKTALVNRWLADLATRGYDDARRVYGWSFYSQGSGESRNASADPFFAHALEWFGDEDPTAGSPWQKGERLAERVRRERTLLVLDGLEPLQEPPKTGLPTGRLKDPGLQALLRELAASNQGLCLVTTREEAEDLEPKVGATVERLDLRELTPEAGAELLRSYNLEAPRKELEEIVESFAGHALALTLLATYLRDVAEGDVRRWREVPLLEEDAAQGGHAFRVMHSYEDWLGEGPELSVLYLLGLFDRTATKEEIEALLEEPAIPGLTEDLVEAGEAGFRRAVARLREARLVSEPGGAAGDLDAHPLVRTYFGERLEESNEEAYRAGHLRLYEHLKEAAPEYPESIDQMQPLYHAVHHGCRAGRLQEAMEEVFYPRIRRRTEAFSVLRLGAFSSELAALSGFFERPWDRPAEGLSEPDKGFVLNEAGFALRAQGRLAEAVGPVREALRVRRRLEHWKNGAVNAGNLSELLLTLGRVEEAVQSARDSVDLADRSGDEGQKTINRTTLADALHQAGRLAEARELFEEVEAMQAERQREYPLLYSLGGYRYCDLLLAQATRIFLKVSSQPKAQVPFSSALPEGPGEGTAFVEAAVTGLRPIRERAEKTLQWVRERGLSVLDIALDHLILGRTHLAMARLDGGPEAGSCHLDRGTDHLVQAVDDLRKAGAQEFLILGFLARAALHCFTEDHPAAQRDLDEAFDIAERGEMRLYLTDAHLERARLRLEEGQTDAARVDVAAARGLVEETGYGRRLPELVALEGWVG